MFVTRLLQADLLFHQSKIHQLLNMLIFRKLKVLSLTVTPQLILIYQHLNNQLFDTADQSDAGQILLLHTEYEVFSQYSLPANVFLPSLASQYTLIRPQKAYILHASQVYTFSKIMGPILFPVHAQHLRPMKKRLIIEFPFIKH